MNRANRAITTSLCTLITTSSMQWLAPALSFLFFFFNDTATTEIYTLSLHDALPIFLQHVVTGIGDPVDVGLGQNLPPTLEERSEEHTSELQSQSNLVCRLLLEKKNKTVACTTCASTHRRPRSHAAHGPAS